jgi:hypothetical protein
LDTVGDKQYKLLEDETKWTNGQTMD